MTDQPTNTELPGTPDLPIEPAPESTPKAVADELFSHGLLTYLHTDTPARQGERIGKLIAALDHDALRATGVPPVQASFRFPIRTARGWVALAACLTLATVAVFIGIPGEQSAQAEVQQSIEAMRSTAGGDRRYEIRLQRPTDDALPSLPGAIIDMRSPNLLLLRANAPDGHEIIAGRDATGDWCIRRDSGIERDHPEQAWPKWSKVGEESLLVDSVDRLLEELTKSYDLQREGTATLEGQSTSFRHIVGTKKRLRSPGGDRVEVWIDPATKSVERLEMRWDLPLRGAPNAPAPAPGADGAGPGARGPDDAPNGPADAVRPERGPPSGPRDPLGPRPPRRDGPGPDGFGPGGPPDGDDGPGGLGGRGLRNGQGLDGPHPRPHPRPDGPLPGQRPDGPRRDGADGQPLRPLGARLPGGGGFGPPPRGPGPGARANPPRMLVMQRVDAPAFDGAWFTPEAHVAKE